MSESQLPRYTWEEISRHNNASSLWIVLDGKVYDVTSWKDEHPGGEEVLLEAGASDATNAFEDVGHSADARELSNKYLIGMVDDTPPKPRDQCRHNSAWILSLLGVVALAAGIIIAYRIYKK